MSPDVSPASRPPGGGQMVVGERAGAGPATGGAQRAPGAARTRPWLIVAEQECRELWVGGRGPILIFAFSILLSVVTYLVASSQVLNYLEQREAVSLLVQVTVGVGVLVALVVGADAISGERERATLETLLLTPTPRQHIVVGKLLAALSLWLAALCVSVPYVWVLASGISLVGQALLLGLVVGTVLAVGLAALGLLISGMSGTNRMSLAASLFILLALFAPTQLPSSARQGWLGDFFIRVNPVASGEHYLGAVLVNAHSWTRDLSYLAAPLVTAAAACAVLIWTADWLLRLDRGGTSR